MHLKLVEMLAEGVQTLHPSVLGISTRKISPEVATIVAEALYQSIVESARLMPDKLAAMSTTSTHTEWGSYTLEDFEHLDLDDPSIERADFKNIIKELISIASFWKLACSV